ncbi:hypothetical protein D4764_04G0013960 [Takifugu flavidus]|uniref:Uncharacterized protein n=1 Tax=Takifugu flavidus TaxID=433684 RepID=A0A5C6N797_9TELE|nr:hypothetical protein D4764_04G0013960 [Takifugu flavidus]
MTKAFRGKHRRWPELENVLEDWVNTQRAGGRGVSARRGEKGGKQKNYTGKSITSLLDEEEERRGEERRGEERRGDETMTQWGDRGLSGDHVSGLRQPWPIAA